MAGKGQPKTGGRKKGVSNKFTRDVKVAVLDAFYKGPADGPFKDIGGEEWLRRMMQLYPKEFLILLGKVMPTQVVDANDEPVQFAQIKLVAPKVIEHEPKR